MTEETTRRVVTAEARSKALPQAGGRAARQLATPIAAPEAGQRAEPSLGRRPTRVSGSPSYGTIAGYYASWRAGA